MGGQDNDANRSVYYERTIILYHIPGFTKKFLPITNKSVLQDREILTERLIMVFLKAENTPRQDTKLFMLFLSRFPWL